MTLEPSFKPGRIFFLVFTLSVGGVVSSKASFPAFVDKRVNDFAKVMADNRKNQITEILDRMEQQTGVEMTLVTVPSLSNYLGTPATIESFAEGLFNRWGVGHKKINSGVLILVAVKDKQIRFEFGSDFKKEDISDLKNIFNKKIRPFFIKENYSEGMFASAVYTVQMVTVPLSFWQYNGDWLLLGMLSVIFLVGGLFLFLRMKREPALLCFFLTCVILVLAFKKFPDDLRLHGFGGGTSAGVGLTARWMDG